MDVFKVDFWSSIQPYILDLGIALMFGLGYCLFKSLNNNTSPDPNEKEKKNTNTKWAKVKTMQKFNSIILANNDKNEDAFKILDNIQKAGLNPDSVTYNCLFDMSYKLHQFEQAKKLYEEMSDFTSPVQPDIVTYNIILKGCVIELKEMSKSSNLSKKNEIAEGKKVMVEKIFGYLSDLTNRGLKLGDRTYNTAIDACVEAGDLNKAWELYSQMKLCGTVKPDMFTYSILIKGLKLNIDNESNIDKAIEILNMLKSTNGEDKIKVDEVFYNSVMDTCVKYQKIELAEKFFADLKDQGLSPSLITYSIIIKGYGAILQLEKAMSMLNEMKLANIRPNSVIYLCLLNLAIKCNRMDVMEILYESLIADGIEPSHLIYTNIIKGYNKVKKYDKAIIIFDSIPQKELRISNITTFNSILESCIESKRYQKLFKIYEYIKKESEECESFPQPNVVTYSTMIKGYAKCGNISEAITIYKFLINNAFKLDEVLFNTICDGFARANEYELAESVLEDMKKCGIKRSAFIYSILMKMYSNKSDENRCLQLYQEMKNDDVQPNLVTYTTLIQLYNRSKQIQKAIDVYEEMKKNGIKPDQVTYNFMVNGCTFNQKLEKGMEYLVDSIRDKIKLSENSYDNCLGYLLNNKFMKHKEKIQYASKILKELKENNININYEIYSKLLQLIYRNDENNKQIESKLGSNYNKFSEEDFEDLNSFNKSSKRERPNKQNYSRKNKYEKIK